MANRSVSTVSTSSRSNASDVSKGKHSLSGRAVWAGRIVFVAALCVVAAVLGGLSWYFLTESETALAESQFRSIADRALDSALDITLRKRLGTVTMSSIAAAANPDASAWPFVTITGYENIARNLIETSDGREMGFCPLVTPEQLEKFENFAYDYYLNERNPPFPNGTAESSFGRGVWGVDPSLNTTDNRYRETADGTTTYDSPNRIFAPILHHNMGAFPALMLNLHFQSTRGTVIDDIIECSERRRRRKRKRDAAAAALGKAEEEEQQQEEMDEECGAITDMLILTSQEVEPGPGALIMQPIYPHNDKTELTGIIASSIVWDEVLENTFPDEVNGVDCVLRTETQVYTYNVFHGIPTLTGEGDLHDPKYEDYRETIELTGSGLFSSESATYTLSIYPSEDFFLVYGTRNPTAASIGAVLIILFTSTLFFLYDFFVRQEFHAKKDLLDAKREFVRFISHEVRTPLNTVCMGLTLLREEMGSVLRTRFKKQQDNKEQIQIPEHEHNNSQQDPEETENHHPEGPANTAAAGSEELVVQVKQDEVKDWHELSDEVLCNAKSAVDVLSDLLNYDKIQNGTLQLEVTSSSVAFIVEHCATEFKLPAAKKNIQFDLDCGTLLCVESGGCYDPLMDSSVRLLPTFASGDHHQYRIVGDKIRIIQIIRNLVSNAFKFTPEGGNVTVRITYSQTNDDEDSTNTHRAVTKKFTLKDGQRAEFFEAGHLHVAVTDTGAGMSEEQTQQVFMDGTQFNVNELQAGQGSGLGLFIAKGIAEQHGGSLSVFSEGLGKGTTFTLGLPLFKSATAMAATPTTTTTTTAATITAGVVNPEEPSAAAPRTVVDPMKTSQSSSSFVGGGGPHRHHHHAAALRVLVVDDALTNRKLLLRLLRNRGHDCDQAADGTEAVEVVAESMKSGNTPFDSILLDYEMIQLNGPEAASEIRKMGCDAFIVGVTGNLLPEDIAYFQKCGANEVLPKPLNLTDLEGLWVEYGIIGRQGGSNNNSKAHHQVSFLDPEE